MSKQRDLIRLSLSLPSGELAKELQIFPYGIIKTTKGNFLFSAEAAERLMQADEDWGNQRSADYEHQSLMGMEAPASAWYELALKDDGLWATNIRWTQKAQEYLNNDEYKYFSPAFYTNWDGEIVEYINFALTNLPATKRMDGLLAASILNVYGDNKASESEFNMDLKSLIAVLGMATDSKESDVLARLNALNTQVTSLISLTGAADVTAAMGVLTGWRDAAKQVEKLSADNTALHAELNQGKRKRLLDDAENEGKLTPAMRKSIEEDDGFKPIRENLSSLTAYLEVQPKVVNLGRNTHPDPNKTATNALTEEDKAVAAQLGLSLEAFKSAKEIK